MDGVLMFRAGRLKLENEQLVPKSDPGFVRIVPVRTSYCNSDSERICVKQTALQLTLAAS